MFFKLLKLQLLKAVRSVSLGRKLVAGIVLGLFGLIILLNILALGIGLPFVVEQVTGRQDVISVLNSWLIYFFLMEMMYRFFLQKMTVIELEHYLHLPIGRNKIIHFLLARSFFSPFNLIVLLLFVPVYITEAVPAYGTAAALMWLFTVILMSWTVHWFVLWFKQRFGDSVGGILTIFGIFLAGVGSAWYGWFHIGTWVAPFFTASLQGIVPLLLALALCSCFYLMAFFYYRTHAYLEELGQRERRSVVGDNLSLFNRFGLAGAIADLELKLILRHKKSRTYLILTVLFLAYGLLFYTDGSYGINEEVPMLSIFIGTFITGMFIMNYGQLFLSWNSPHFDFYLGRKNGIESLVKGKYLLFFGVSLAAFIVAVPYAYFGWNILFVHTATFLFNIGINIHIIIYMALWKPKPMDLGKGAVFNYEGVGAAQFLMGIPMLGLPYLIYLPFALWVSDIAGLVVLGAAGVLGIIFYEKFAMIQVNRILNNRYTISSSFRQEL